MGVFLSDRMDSSADDCLIQEAIRQDPERTSLTACNNGIDHLPAYIVRLQRLKRLTMYDNMLSELPPELGELSCLQYLNLRFNRIEGLPAEIGKLAALRELHMEGNKLAALPPEVSSLKSLLKLDLRNNQLQQLPPEIGQLTALRGLWVSGNQLLELPREIGQLAQLEEMWCEDNQLQSLPPGFTSLTKLQRVGLCGNPMQAPPVECCNHGVEAIMLYLKDLAQGFYPLPKLTPGIALVISNDSYGLEACKHNAIAFAELFTSFKFQLFKGQVHNNLTATQIQTLCEELAKHNHSESGAVVIYFTGCGYYEGDFVGVDGELVRISALASLFEASVCPTLRHKPKLIFADLCACDVSLLRSGTAKTLLPMDFLYTLACSPGMDTFVGCPNNMSWWSYLLYRGLRDSGHTTHIVDILKQVSEQFVKQTPRVRELQVKPHIDSFLRMELFFRNDDK